MNEDVLRKLVSQLLSYSHCCRPSKPAMYVLAADDVVNITSYPTCIIKNTNKAGVTSMGHWIAFFIPSRNKYEVMDSYGLPLSRYPDIVPPPGKCIAENCHTLQSNSSYLCGYYCALFLWHRSRGRIYRTFMRYFTDNFDKNDKLVIRLLRSYTAYAWFSLYAICPKDKQHCGKRKDHCEWEEPVNKLGRRAKF